MKTKKITLTLLPLLLFTACSNVLSMLGLADDEDDYTTAYALAALWLSQSSSGCTYNVQSTTTTTTSGNYAVVDTAQTTCYGTNSGTLACADSTTAAQDGFYTRNAPSYTVNSDGVTVSDNNTALMWTKSPDTNGDGSVNSSDKLTQLAAYNYCDSLTKGGFSDWRLPSVKEQYSLMNFGQGRDPSSCTNCTSTLLANKTFIDDSKFTVGFGDTSSGERLIDGQYATTNVYAGKIFDTDWGVFGVNHVDGRIKGYECSSTKTFFVMCVRGNTNYGLNNFTDNSNGTVTDSATSLVWQKADDGNSYTFPGAINYCNSLSLGGQSDWRVPNAKELQSIVDYSRAPDYSANQGPAINSIFTTSSFTNEEGITDYPWYWSSTTHVTCGDSNCTTDDVKYGVYLTFGRALGYYTSAIQDVHGAGAQRSNDKDDVSSTAGASTANVGGGTFYYWGPQGDILRDGSNTANRGKMYVRCVRN
ncbi:MAG: DUF1566 domain-containing protein [Leptospiraceae bacterium]|nr:DUF1566 domain-containing protein [Leptospiraceae bacterium]